MATPGHAFEVMSLSGRQDRWELAEKTFDATVRVTFFFRKEKRPGTVDDFGGLIWFYNVSYGFIWVYTTQIYPMYCRIVMGSMATQI